MTEVNNVASTVLTTLDVGSGIDIVKLSEDLTNAEKEPKQEKIQGDIDATEASISAYALVKFQVDALKTAFNEVIRTDIRFSINKACIFWIILS